MELIMIKLVTKEEIAGVLKINGEEVELEIRNIEKKKSGYSSTRDKASK